MTCSGKFAEPILTVGFGPEATGLATALGLATVAGLATGLAAGLAAALGAADGLAAAAGAVVGLAGAVVGGGGAAVGLAPPAWQALSTSAIADAPAASKRILRIW